MFKKGSPASFYIAQSRAAQRTKEEEEEEKGRRKNWKGSRVNVVLLRSGERKVTVVNV